MAAPGPTSWLCRPWCCWLHDDSLKGHLVLPRLPGGEMVWMCTSRLFGLVQLGITGRIHLYCIQSQDQKSKLNKAFSKAFSTPAPPPQIISCPDFLLLSHTAIARHSSSLFEELEGVGRCPVLPTISRGQGQPWSPQVWGQSHQPLAIHTSTGAAKTQVFIFLPQINSV